MKRILVALLAALLALSCVSAALAEEERDTFTVFVDVDPDVAIEGNKVIEWFEDLANVNLDFIVSTGSEMLTLLLSTGDYPEIFLTGFSNNDIVYYGVESQIFVPIDEYIDEHMPNVSAYLDAHPTFANNIVAPDGHIYGVPQFPATMSHGWVGGKMWINTEWLDRLDLEMPTTTDELYDVLVAFRDRDPNGNGIADEIPLSGAIGTWDAEPEYSLMNSFVPTDRSSFVFVEDGVVKFSATDDRYREGLAYIKKLYDEGLLDPACFTQDLNQLIQLGQNPEIEILGAYASGHVGMALDLTDIERSRMYNVLVTPRGPEGQAYYNYGNPENASGTVFAVTDKCHDVARALEVIDLMYTEEVSVASEYGVPGINWTEAAEGEIDMEGNQAKYKSVTTRVEQSTTVRDNEFKPFCMNDEKRTKFAIITDDIYNPDSQVYELRLNQATMAYIDQLEPMETLPVIWADPDDAEIHAQLQVSIVNEVKQATTRFITGDMDLETQWDAYVAGVENLGLEDYVAYYQKGYDDAMAKTAAAGE